MTQSIELRPWWPHWPEDYRKVEAELRALLGVDVMLEHVGSSAVPGMSAKPVLDVLVGVGHGWEIEGAVSCLSASGFRRGAAAPSSGPAAFLMRDRRGRVPAVNLHLTVPGERQWMDMVRFRDRLRSDLDLAKAYGELKAELAAQAGSDLATYTNGKSDFIARVLVPPAVNRVLGHQRGELGHAGLFRGASILLQLVVALVAATSVFFNDGETLLILAGVGVVLLCVWLWTHSVYRRHREAGEQARRLLQVRYGLDQPVAALSHIADDFEAPTKGQPSDILAYFATRAPPGMQRLAEMVDESAFFTVAIQRRSARIMWAVLFVGLLAAFLGWIVLGAQLEEDMRIVAVRVFMALAVFLLSSDVVGAAFAHGAAASTMKTIRLRLAAARDRGFPEGDVLQAMSDYNAAVEGAPLPLPGVYEALSPDLTRKWDQYKAETGIGR